MDAIEMLKSRRSIRRFWPNPISQETIEELLDCARLAPTAVNVQPWEFVVVTDPRAIERLGQIARFGHFIAEAPVCIAVYCKNTKYYVEDGAAAIENLLLAATALDLGATWVGGDKEPWAKEVAKLLKVPRQYKLMGLVPIGRSDQEPEVPRRALAEVIHWEKF
jgi:nitroreductase